MIQVATLVSAASSTGAMLPRENSAITYTVCDSGESDARDDADCASANESGRSARSASSRKHVNARANSANEIARRHANDAAHAIGRRRGRHRFNRDTQDQRNCHRANDGPAFPGIRGPSAHTLPPPVPAGLQGESVFAVCIIRVCRRSRR